jgi:hypothetical protein
MPGSVALCAPLFFDSGRRCLDLDGNRCFAPQIQSFSASAILTLRLRQIGGCLTCSVSSRRWLSKTSLHAPEDRHRRRLGVKRCCTRIFQYHTASCPPLVLLISPLQSQSTAIISKGINKSISLVESKKFPSFGYDLSIISRSIILDLTRLADGRS